MPPHLDDTRTPTPLWRSRWAVGAALGVAAAAAGVAVVWHAPRPELHEVDLHEAPPAAASREPGPSCDLQRVSERRARAEVASWVVTQSDDFARALGRHEDALEAAGVRAGWYRYQLLLAQRTPTGKRAPKGLAARVAAYRRSHPGDASVGFRRLVEEEPAFADALPKGEEPSSDLAVAEVAGLCRRLAKEVRASAPALARHFALDAMGEP